MTSIQIKLSNKTQSPYRGLRCPTQSGPWVASNVTLPVSHLPLIGPCKRWPSRWPSRWRWHTTLTPPLGLCACCPQCPGCWSWDLLTIASVPAASLQTAPPRSSSETASPSLLVAVRLRCLPSQRSSPPDPVLTVAASAALGPGSSVPGPSRQHVGFSAVAARRLSCPTTCEILVHQPESWLDLHSLHRKAVFFFFLINLFIFKLRDNCFKELTFTLSLISIS